VELNIHNIIRSKCNLGKWKLTGLLQLHTLYLSVKCLSSIILSMAIEERMVADWDMQLQTYFLCILFLIFPVGCLQAEMALQICWRG